MFTFKKDVYSQNVCVQTSWTELTEPSIACLFIRFKALFEIEQTHITTV